MKKTAVTVVIPSFNQQEFLPDAIESALGQTVRCEVIVVDDGSTDHSLDVAKGYEQHGVKVVSQVNKGLPSARNTGIMNATGDFILFLDADDMLQDDCVEKLLKVAKSTKADVVAPSFKTFGTTNELVILIEAPTIEDFKIGNRLGYCALIKRDTLLEVGGYSPKMVFGYEDLHLWHNLFYRDKRIVTVQEVLWLYRTKEHSMITTAKKHHEELMAQINKDFPQLHG